MSKNIVKNAVAFAIFVVLVAPALAQEANAPLRPNVVKPAPVRQEVKDVRQNVKQELEAKRAEVKQQIETRREEFKANVEAKREEMKQQAETKKEELKQKLQVVKDERKKQIVERLDTKVQELNQKRLDHFGNVLEKIEGVLEKIVSRTDKAEANGRDVSAVRTAIENVKTAVAAARDAIAAQAGKTYSITVTTEANLKTDVGSVRQQLVNDLKAVQYKVQAARQAAVAAAQALARIPRVDEAEVEPTATSSAQ